MKKATRRTLDRLKKDGHRATSLEQWIDLRKPNERKGKGGGYWSSVFRFASILDLGTQDDPTVRFLIVLRDQVDFVRELRGLLSRPNVAASIAAAIAGGARVEAVSWTNTADVLAGSWVMRSRMLRLAWNRVAVVGEESDPFAIKPVDPEPEGAYPEPPKPPAVDQNRPKKASATDRTGT